MEEKKKFKTYIYTAKNGNVGGFVDIKGNMFINNGHTLEEFEINCRKQIRNYQDETNDKLDGYSEILKFDHENISFDSLKEKLGEFINNESNMWRGEQSTFNFFYWLFLDQVDNIRGTENDCYHISEKVGDFIKTLEEILGE